MATSSRYMHLDLWRNQDSSLRLARNTTRLVTSRNYFLADSNIAMANLSGFMDVSHPPLAASSRQPAGRFAPSTLKVRTQPYLSDPWQHHQ